MECATRCAKMRPSAPPSVMAANRKNTPVSAALAMSISSVPLCGFLCCLLGPLVAFLRGPLGEFSIHRLLVHAGEHPSAGSVKPEDLASETGHAIVFVGHEERGEPAGCHAQAAEQAAAEINPPRVGLLIGREEFGGRHVGFLVTLKKNQIF